MTAPGTVTTKRSTVLPRKAPVDTGVWFIAGFAEQGPTTPQVIVSMDDYTNVFGARVSYGYLFDALDVFFKEGGSQAIVARVLGPTPVKATHTFLSSTPDNAIVVTADWYGDYGNSISVAILAGLSSGYRVQVSYAGAIVETSGDLTTQADAVTWSATSDYVTITLGSGSHVPATITATALSGGTDDHASATETNWLTAITLFTKDLGPGQVSMPGHTTATGHLNLFAHGAANNRVPLVDFADTSSRATLVTAAAADTAVSGSNGGGGFAPWAVVPGVVARTTRTVPYSAVAAGIMARNDNDGVVPNQPSAGLRFGQSRYALGLSQVAWSEGDGGDRDLLNAAGVNVARVLGGIVTTYGYRTLASPTSDAKDILLSNARQLMSIVAQAQAILDTYVFLMIDGKGHAFSDAQGDLVAMLKPMYDAGALYGNTPQDAFGVDVGPSVNTPTTISELKLRALISVVLSPYAETTEVLIVSTAVTEGVI